MSEKVYTIDEIKEIINEILKKMPVEKAVLFGSYAKNTANKKSDIDIVIDSNGKIKGLKFYALMDEIQEKFDKDVDVIEKAEINDGSKIDDEIEKTGVVIYERER